MCDSHSLLQRGGWIGSLLIRCLRAIGIVVLFLSSSPSSAGAGSIEQVRLFKNRADESKQWSAPLQRRIETLLNLRFATTAFAALAALLAACNGFYAKDEASRRKFAMAFLAAAASGAAGLLTEVRTVYFEADKDSVAGIKKSLGEYQDEVRDQSETYFLDHDRRGRTAEPPNLEGFTDPGKRAKYELSVKDEIGKIDAELAARFEVLNNLDQSRGKLVRRARELLNIDEDELKNELKNELPPGARFWPFNRVVFAQRQQFAYTRPWWWANGMPKDPAYLQDNTGEGYCSDAFAAREYSRYEGRRKLALQLDGSATGTRLNEIIKAIEGSVQDQSQTTETVAKDGTYRTFTWVRLFESAARQKVTKMPAAKSVQAQGAAMLTEQTLLAVNVSAPNRQGTFKFVFNASAANAGPRSLRLQEIAVYEDGSGGSTRWNFEILADNRSIISVPTHRLDDSRKPTRCWPQEKLEGIVPSGAKEIRILGYLGN